MSEQPNGNGNGGRFKPTYDPRITLGSLLSLLTLVGSIFFVSLRYENRITVLETTGGTVAVRLDKFDARIDANSNDIFALRLVLKQVAP